MQRNGMLVLSLVAFATAVGLFGVRQSLASEPVRKASDESESVADLFPTQALATRTREVPHSRDQTPGPTRIPDLASGLNYHDDGYLGSRRAMSQDGRQVLTFLWFRNEATMLAWYENRVERQIIHPYFPNLSGQKPVFYGDRDPNRNVMVLATLTPNEQAKSNPLAAPISEATFDVYTATAPRTSLGETRARGSHLVD